MSNPHEESSIVREVLRPRRWGFSLAREEVRAVDEREIIEGEWYEIEDDENEEVTEIEEGEDEESADA